MGENRTPVVLSGVTKKFGTTVAVQSLSWAPRRGQVTALVGLNGAGKSTTMRVMTGLIKPTEGSVKVVAAGGERALSAMIETPGLFTGMSVRRNLDIHRVLTGAPSAQIDEVAGLVQVQDVLGKRVGTLSQGYRQRVAIGVALMGSPAVLLLDEPTNALDPDAILQLRRLIREVADRGTAVVVSTHQLRELEGTADALTLIHDGQVRYDGPFDDFVGKPSLRIRATDDTATSALATALEAKGIQVGRTAGGLRVVTDGSADRLATRIFGIAAESGVELVELGHVTPTLEEAFHTAISGAGS